MYRTKKPGKCLICNNTEIVCGFCQAYTKSYTFQDYGICEMHGRVAKECGYVCDLWVCTSCGSGFKNATGEK